MPKGHHKNSRKLIPHVAKSYFSIKNPIWGLKSYKNMAEIQTILVNRWNASYLEVMVLLEKIRTTTL